MQVSHVSKSHDIMHHHVFQWLKVVTAPDVITAASVASVASVAIVKLWGCCMDVQEKL